MDEYEVEFDKLSQFAPTLAKNAESRMRTFEEGWKPHMCHGLVAGALY